MQKIPLPDVTLHRTSYKEQFYFYLSICCIDKYNIYYLFTLFIYILLFIN